MLSAVHEVLNHSDIIILSAERATDVWAEDSHSTLKKTYTENMLTCVGLNPFQF